MSQKKEKSVRIFFAEITKGYTPKVTIDAIAECMERVVMQIKKGGMFIAVSDKDTPKNSRIMIDVKWPRDDFGKYDLRGNSMKISFNVKQLQTHLKSVKKKDSLTFEIFKKGQTPIEKMKIIIKPTKIQEGSTPRSEVFFINIKFVDDIIPKSPETFTTIDGEVRKIYGHPMSIPSTDFQKIKKLLNTAKNNFSLIIQKNNYLSFRVGKDGILESELNFGELLDDPESDSVDIITSDQSKESSSTEDNSIDITNKSESKKVTNNLIFESEESNCETSDEFSDFPFVYKKHFNKPLFGPLVKLPGMCSQIGFYAPSIPQYPLKINSKCFGLGEISIYIKDTEELNYTDEK